MKTYFLAAVALLLLASCTKDIEDIAPVEIEEQGQDSLAAKQVSGILSRIRKNSYHIQNNVWSKSRGQNGNGAGFQKVWDASFNRWGTVANHKKGNNQIKSYPGIIIGKHYGDGPKYSKGMPVKIGNIKSAKTTWHTQNNLKRGNTSYDIWFDSNKNKSSENDYELMIWLNKKNINPIAHGYNPNGSAKSVGSFKTNGITFNVYHKYIGSKKLRVMSFLASRNINNVNNLDIKKFIDYCKRRGWMNNNLYMTSVQAGWEIVEGGSCQTTKFSLNIKK